MPKAEQTKAFIIEKTAPVFNMKGFAGTSLSDMEKATGLTKGSIYNSFANKDEVALAVFDFNLKQVNTLLSETMQRHTSIRAKLLAYVKIYTDNDLQHQFPSGGCPILNTAIDADDTHPELKNRASIAIENWKNNIVHLLNRGVQKNEFKAAIDTEEMAVNMVASIEGAVMMARVTGKRTYLKTVMKSIEKAIKEL
jgi:TetR/AcrR family transcriptional regulator, transcriptional repressor for nem operon